MCGILLHYGRNQQQHGVSLPSYDYSDQQISESIDRFADGVLTDTLSGEEKSRFESLVPKILARGSDFARYVRVDQDLEIFSSVLSLRSPFTQQPVQDDAYILQFNGELYNSEIDGDSHANDTNFVFSKLTETNDVAKTVGLLEGEFAICVFDRGQNKIYFAKDNLGKKSLSYSLLDGELYVSSCTPTGQWKTSFQECLNAKLYIYDVASAQLEVSDYAVSPDLPATYTVNNQIGTDDIESLVRQLQGSLQESVDKRIRNIFPLHEAASNFGLLFSGGLDCTVLACLAGISSQPGTKIDLLNVSFHNPRTKMDPSGTPDRLLSLKSCYHLNKMFKEKGVQYQLVEVDVPYDEYSRHRQKVIDLIYPNDTEMDLSIAIAFYFASRGAGNRVLMNTEDCPDFRSLPRVPYISACKVLLSGLGADELFGGYTRHERIFTPASNYRKKQLKNQRQEEREFDMDQMLRDLRDELQADLSNLHVRNLARDDKVVSTWSKELRYPFLDTHFIDFVARDVPLDLKLNYDASTGTIIRKFLLRKLAHSLEMDWVADEAKRAIQFGAKSAKMEAGTGRMKGTDKLS